MTRINTIDVQDLTDQHLMAEYREMPMVHAALQRSKTSKKGLSIDSIPPKYTLNTGHVKFFYNKGTFILKRYLALVDELRKRGYNINPGERKIDWKVFDHTLKSDWTPTSRDHSILIARLVERINAKPQWYKLNGKPIGDDYLNKLAEKYDVKIDTL